MILCSINLSLTPDLTTFFGDNNIANLRNAWDINLACNPIWESPISPSISAFGTSAATESTTITSNAPLLTKLSVISNACSPVSGCETIKQDGEIKGSRTRVKVVKNKVAPPFREAEFDIVYGEGISRAGNILDMAVNMDIIEKSGSWFSYNGERIGQGRENVKKYLKENPEILDEVESKVRSNAEKAFEESLGEEIPEIDMDDDGEE